MSEQELARRCVQKMLAEDAFSAWLAVELIEIAPGRCVLQMVVRREMTNGFAVCHGGITFAFADSAFAFASNTRGRVAVSIDNSISYPAPVVLGDKLTATAEERSLGERVGFYDVIVTKQDQSVVALFHGTVFRTSRHHFPSEATS